jgi:hypothetical protein
MPVNVVCIRNQEVDGVFLFVAQNLEKVAMIILGYIALGLGHLSQGGRWWFVFNILLG